MRPEGVIRRYQVTAPWPVFAIGVKERGVTVASQQRRALYLIDALLHTGVVAAGSQVAIVGGGAAGLTAAAWAARAGVRVCLLERAGELMAMLRGNHTRLLHPNLYSWPEPGWKVRSAGLPIMSWDAGIAGHVAHQIETQFVDVERATGMIDVRRHVSVRWPWPPVKRGRHVEVSWREKDGGDETRVCAAVVLAVGFGPEQHTGPDTEFPGYWQDDWVQEAQRRPEQRYLVHGCADGGLTDLMRLKIDGFDQDGIERLLDAGGDRLAAVEADVRRIERTWADSSEPGAGEAMHDAYRGLHVPWLEDAIAKQGIRPHRVTMIDKYPALGQRRFALNKLLASGFVRRAADWDVTWLHRPLAHDDIRRGTSSRFAVNLDRPEDRWTPFDRVLKRCGPVAETLALCAEVDAGCIAMTTGPDPLTAEHCPQHVAVASNARRRKGLSRSVRRQESLLDLVRNLLLFLRHDGRETAELCEHRLFVPARERALEVLAPLRRTVLALDAAPRIARLTAWFLRRSRGHDVAVVARALVEAIDLLWGDRLHGRLRGSLLGGHSRTFGPNQLHPRQPAPDDRRGVRDGGLERVALMPAGATQLVVDWSRHAWPDGPRIGGVTVPASLSDFDLVRDTGTSFFGATHRAPATHEEDVCLLFADIEAGNTDVGVLPEFALGAAPAWIDRAQRPGCVIYGGIGHIEHEGRAIHQRVVRVDGAAPRLIEKRAPTRYVHGVREVEEDIHVDPRAAVHAISAADGRSLLLLAGEDCACAPFAALARTLNPTFILGVGGPIGPGLMALLEEMDLEEIQTFVVGFSKTVEAGFDPPVAAGTGDATSGN